MPTQKFENYYFLCHREEDFTKIFKFTNENDKLFTVKSIFRIEWVNNG